MAVRKNLSFMGAAHLVSFLLNFASVIIVSRLLTPMEIGIYSVSVAVLGMAHIFRDFGIGQYLIQASQVGKVQIRAAFSITLYSSWLIALILFLARQPLANLYDHHGVADVLSILCLNFVILPFGTPLLSLMQRDLQFNYLAINIILSTLVQTTVTVGCVIADQGYLSMAWGALSAHIAKIILLNVLRPGELFMWPTLKGLGEVFRFGSLTSAASIIKELGSGAPGLIMGRTLGFVEVAFFSRAAGLNKMLVARVIALVHGVYFPTFASELRKGRDGAHLFSMAMLYMVAITAPLFAVLAVVSEPLIKFLFGDQWERSAPLASLICFYAMLVSPYSLYSLSLIAAGKVKQNLIVEIVVQSVQILVLISSIWLSLESVVALFIFVTLIQIASAQHALRLTFGLRFLSHLKTMFPSLILIPFSVAGPIVLLYFSKIWDFSDHNFLILVNSAILATGGWILGVYITDHVMLNEVHNALAYLKKINTYFLEKMNNLLFDR